MFKYHSSIVTDLPIHRLASIFGPINIVGEVYVTRSYPSKHRLKTLLGTAQSIVQLKGYSFFAAKIFSGKDQFPIQRKEYQKQSIKHSLDYGIPLNAFFYDRQAAMPELFPEERASFQRWLRPSNQQPLTGADIRTIIRYWESTEPHDFAYYVQQFKGSGYSMGEIKQWVDGLYMLQSLPKYQGAAQDITYPPMDQQLRPGMPDIEPINLPMGGESMGKLAKLLAWIDLHSYITDEGIQQYVKRASGMDVPIEKIQPFIARLRMMMGRTNS